MKKKVFLFVVSVIFIMLISAMLLPVGAEEPTEDSENIYNAETYYYDRINERAQWCYNWLKDFYDNYMPGNVPDDIPFLTSDEFIEYKIDMAHLLPENPTAEDYYALGRDFLIGDLALKADDPLYVCKGRVSGWSRAYSEDEDVWFDLHIRYSNLHSEEATALASARIKQIVDTVGEGDRYTKLRKLSAYLIDKTFYDPYVFGINAEGYDALGGRGLEYNSSVYGVLTKNIAVCDGYSKTVKLLCNELDIPCIIMGNHAHAWNLVQMDDGCWYRIDITNACRVGWDGELPQTHEEFFDQIFVNNNTLQNAFGLYADPYMLGVNNDFRITDFPPHADGQYKYTGDTTDFSYIEAPLEYDFGEPQFIYRVNPDGNSCTIIDYAGEQSGDLIIPDEIDGYTVTAIDPYAFYYCTGFDGKLVISKNVRSIGGSAFAGCYNLTSVEMADSMVEYIGAGMDWGDGQEIVSGGAFIGCKGLREITLPDTLTKLYKYAFYDCDGLASVSFGAHVISVGDMAFDECLSEVVLKAPAGSCVEEYASLNGLCFEENGRTCSMESADGLWYFVDGEDVHFQMCEHKARINSEPHSGGAACGDKCDVCKGEYCANIGDYSHTEPHLEGAQDANCIHPAYTGSLTCRCGVTLSEGELVGEVDPDMHPYIVEDWCADTKTHFRQCGYCWNPVDIEEHYGGTATTTQRAVCVICGTEYGEFTANSPENNTEAPENNTEAPENNTEKPENNTEKPESNTPENNTETPEDSTQAPDGFASDADNSGGCGSTLGMGLIGFAVALAAGFVFSKKRYNN